jgi:hypothetical protein
MGILGRIFGFFINLFLDLWGKKRSESTVQSFESRKSSAKVEGFKSCIRGFYVCVQACPTRLRFTEINDQD